MEKVVITGGGGMIGRSLCHRLIEKGYEVALLSRNTKKTYTKAIASYWKPEQNIIDQNLINSADYIIHLAGANIGKKRWTKKRKKTIIRSRINSANFLLEQINLKSNKLKAFISSSAIGYYGSISSEKIFTEEDLNANDFLGKTCKLWEQSANNFQKICPRIIKIRTGIVFTDKGGILPTLVKQINHRIGSSLGNGKQYIPWIHLHDLCTIYIQAIQNSNMTGAYNAVAPEHITNRELIRKIAAKLNRSLWLPNIPSLIIRLFFGEMSVLLLHGSRISSEKLESTLFKFKYPSIDKALDNLIPQKQ